MLKHHVYCGMMQCRISAHLVQPEKKLGLAVQAHPVADKGPQVL